MTFLNSWKEVVVGTYSKDSVNYVKVKGLVRNDSRSEVKVWSIMEKEGNIKSLTYNVEQ
jgi:hypothetical protein